MNIFDKLVYNENTLTELLRNMLRFDDFRRIFLNLIEHPNQEINFEHISAQQGITNGRPDLIISNNQVDIYIEIKIQDAFLTDNQPLGYLKSLHSRKSKKYRSLVLLIPSDYKHLSEYKNRLDAWNTLVSDDIATKIITWTDLIHVIQQFQLHSGNPILAEFTNLLKQWFEPKRIILGPTFHHIMFDKNTAHALKDLSLVITQFHDQFIREEFKISYFKKNILNEYGFTILLHEEVEFFFGLWFAYWQDCSYPLCFGIRSARPEIIDEWVSQMNKQSFAVTNYLYGWRVSHFETHQLTGDYIREYTNRLTHVLHTMFFER